MEQAIKKRQVSMVRYQSPFGQIKNFIKGRSALSILILINIAVFILINVAHLFYWLYTLPTGQSYVEGASRITYWLAVPSDLSALLHRPWTLLTYMFVQENFFHIFFNMIVLYFGGKIFTEFLSSRKLVSTYLTGGIAGAVFFIAAYNIFPVFREDVSISVALGASASVLAILIAAATYTPNYAVVLFLIGRIRLKYLALILVVIDILSINRGNPGGHIAHLGGAMWGFVSILAYHKGFKGLGGKLWYRLADFFQRMNRRKYTRYKEVRSERPFTDEEYNRIRAEKQKKIDAILEKISRSGYDSLTKEEKDLLFRASNKK
jgi:membrane associated rhomboid family serine protease